MEIEIDIDENNLEEEKYIKNIRKKKILSVEFFKNIYNTFVEEKSQTVDNYKDYKIEKIDTYNIMKCIDDNINDENSRYLLLGIQPSLAILIYQNIKKNEYD